MAKLKLPSRDRDDLLAILEAHAIAGDRQSIYALASIAMSSGNRSVQTIASALMAKQPEFTDEERDMYQSVVRGELQFKKVREQHNPGGSAAIWALEPT